MRITRSVAVAVLLACPLAVGAQTIPVATRGEAELVDIERRIGQANLNCDYKYFAEIEGDDFFFTDASGGTSDKKADLATEKDCRKSNGTYEVDQTRVVFYGTTAVVTGRVTTKQKDKDDKEVTRRSRFTDVFVRRNGRWQLVAGQSTRIPEPRPPQT